MSLLTLKICRIIWHFEPWISGFESTLTHINDLGICDASDRTRNTDVKIWPLVTDTNGKARWTFCTRKLGLKQSLFIIRILINHKKLLYMYPPWAKYHYTITGCNISLLTYRIPISEQTGRKNLIKGDNTSRIQIIGNTGGICWGSGGRHQYTNTNPKPSVNVWQKGKNKLKMQNDELWSWFWSFTCMFDMVCLWGL